MKKILNFCLCFVLTIASLQAQEKDLKDIYLTNESFNKSLSRWMDFYELTISDFKFDSSYTFSLEDDPGSAYKREFGEEELSYEPMLNHYSPNKRKYIELLPAKGVYKEQKQYYFGLGDDCEEIYYVDLDNKKATMILWTGSSHSTEDAFWLNDSIFILVSKERHGSPIHITRIYTMLKDKNELKVQTYKALMKIVQSKEYFQNVVLKERNIKEYE